MIISLPKKVIKFNFFAKFQLTYKIHAAKPGAK